MVPDSLVYGVKHLLESRRHEFFPVLIYHCPFVMQEKRKCYSVNIRLKVG